MSARFAGTDTVRHIVNDRWDGQALCGRRLSGLWVLPTDPMPSNGSPRREQARTEWARAVRLPWCTRCTAALAAMTAMVEQYPDGGA